MNLNILFDPLTNEFVCDTSELGFYLARHFLIELALPMSIFIAVMLILLVDWSWIPITSIERKRGKSLEDHKKSLFI